MSCENCLGCSTANNGLSPITSVFLILTESCSLSCRYCFIHQQPKHMTFDLAMEATKWLIKQAEANGKTPSINYFGGEPLLKYDQIIYPLTKWIREEYKKPFNLGITTNGILLDRDKMDFFKQNSVGMLFSIDGDKEIQDRNRPLKNGGSSFDILKDKIPMVLEYYPNMTFRATFDHDDKDIMARVHKFAIEQGYNNIFHIPNNLADWTEEEKEHLKQQMHDLADYWMDLFREGKTIDFQPFGKAINYIYRINTMDERKGHRDEVRGIGYGKCGTGATGFASVSPEGKLYSCQEIVGNLNGHAETYCIGDIWNGTNEERRFELASQFNVLDVHSGREGRCNDCILNHICDGGCIMNNVMFSHGNPHVLPEITCIYNETSVWEMKRIMETMAEERNETFKKYFLSVKNRRN